MNGKWGEFDTLDSLLHEIDSEIERGLRELPLDKDARKRLRFAVLTDWADLEEEIGLPCVADCHW